MRFPDVAGMTLSEAEPLLKQYNVRWFPEEIRPPRDRRGSEEKGPFRILRAQEEENGVLKLIICRV